MKLIRYSVFPLLILLLLSSCLGMETTVSLNEDESGQIDLFYRVSQMVVYLGQVEGTPSNFPLPIEEEAFLRTVNGIPGLSLSSYEREENEADVLIRARISFDSLAALNALYGSGIETGGGPAISIEKNGEQTVYRQLLYPGNPDGLSGDSGNMLESFFSEYGFTFSLNTPKAVSRTSLGELSASGRRVSVSFPTEELLRRSDPLVWEVVW